MAFGETLTILGTGRQFIAHNYGHAHHTGREVQQ